MAYNVNPHASVRYYKESYKKDKRQEIKKGRPDDRPFGYRIRLEGVPQVSQDGPWGLWFSDVSLIINKLQCIANLHESTSDLPLQVLVKLD